MSTYSDISLCEAAAVFIATLAFPANEEKSDRLVGYLLDFIGEQIASFPGNQGLELQRLREKALKSGAKGNALFRHATRIISSERLIAAKMAFPKFRLLRGDKYGFSKHEDVRTPCSKDMIADVSSDLTHPNRQRDPRGQKARGGESECNKSNIQHRCWKPSLPALHMALALHVEIIKACREGFDAIDLFADPDLVERLIRVSWDYAPDVSAIFNIEKQRILMPFVAT